MESFNIQMADKNYFVTGLDVYTLRRGLEILSGLQERLDLTKILFAKIFLMMKKNILIFIIRSESKLE